MKTQTFIAAGMLCAANLIAADSDKQDALTAAKKLAAAGSYSWTTTVVVPEGTRWRPGPTEGKTQKDGLTWVSMKMGENTMQAVIKGDKSAVSNQDGSWQSTSELENEQGQGRFRAMFVRNLTLPADQATDILGSMKSVTKEGDAYTGELTEAGARKLLTFRARSGGEGPTVADPKGSAKFWVRDGVLSKYEFKVKGTVSFNGNDFENDRTTTVEIKDVGTTKVSAPEEATKKLST